MTESEAKDIIAKAKPIEFPNKNKTITLGTRKITSLKDLNYGNCRRKKRKNSEST